MHRSNAFLIPCLLTLSVCQQILAADGRPPAPVAVAPVVVLDAAPRVWVPGTVLSRTDAEVSSEVAGRINWIADPGTRVKVGDVIARIDNELWTIAVEDATANTRRLEARLEFLRREAERLGSLAKVNSAARSQLDESVANRQMGIEELAQANALMKRSRHMLSRTEVRAPFAGQIVERLADPGEYVAIGTALGRLVDLVHLEIRVQAPLRVAPFVREQLRLPIRDEVRTVEGVVSTVIPVGNLESRSFEIRLDAANPSWVIGTPIRVGLPTSQVRRIVAVPRDALVLREAGAHVFRVDKNKVKRIAVETGIGADDLIEVTSPGLSPGQLVVVKGAELLRDGQNVADTNGSIGSDAGSGF